MALIKNERILIKLHFKYLKNRKKAKKHKIMQKVLTVNDTLSSQVVSRALKCGKLIRSAKKDFIKKAE
jgi:hypothetical protein